MGDKEVGGFMKVALCISVRQTNYSRATTLPWYGTGVGTPDYPSGIPDMHKIHDPMISVSSIHISELITELHQPLQYQNKVLQLVT
jgi:hypothetical protein